MKTFPLFLLVTLLVRAAFAADPATFLELPYRYVIGGYSDGQWLNSEKAGKRLKPGTDYRIFTLKGEAGRLTASKAAPDADVCMDIWMAEIGPPIDTHGIAVAATWNPMPRVVKSAVTSQEVYLKAVSDILISQGIRKPVVKIKQHLRVDLDGDGAEEVLISATHYPTAEGEGSAPTTASAGNYSFVALRRVLGGKVTTQILDGEFYEKAQDFNAPNVHEVGGLLDLDGDGKMEIILHSQYYEGGGTTVWKLESKAAVKVLEIACGV